MQLLSNLDISDYNKKIINEFPKVWNVTKDPKFVTARHSLQAIWGVGLAGEEQKNMKKYGQKINANQRIN